MADGFSRLLDQSKASQTHGDIAVLTRQSSTSRGTQQTSTMVNMDTRTTSKNLPYDIYNKIALVHNAWKGHRGITATLRLLKEEGLQWRNMKKDVTQFCNQCPTCQKQNIKKVEYNATPYTTASYKPHSRLNVDTFIVNSEDEDKKTAVVVVVDTCTRWVELYPIPNLEQEFVAYALLQHFGRYGPPEELLTDQGSEYLNTTVKNICNSQMVKQLHTPIAHSHEHNAKVERVNKELKRHLVNYCQDNRIRKNWSRALPAVQYIINSTTNKQTGYTPFELLFGPAVNNRQFQIDPLSQSTMSDSEFSTWFTEQQEIHATILEKAIELQRQLDAKHIEERTLVPTSYDIGEYVLVAYPETLLGDRPPNKLMPLRKGPMKVIDKDIDAYTVLDLVTRRAEVIHLSRMFPFLYDATKIDPENIALRDREEFVVGEILDDTIDLSLPTKLWKFLVLWKGYDIQEASWVSWNNLKEVGVLHQYMRTKRLGRYIPKAHQKPEDRKVIKQMSKKQPTTRK